MRKTDKGNAARAVFKKDAADRKADNAAAAREEERRNLPPVVCLGMEGNQHVLYSTRNKRLHKLTADRLKLPALLEMGAREHWERHLFPELAAAGESVARGKLVEAAQEWIFSISGCKMFNAEKVRSRGIWKTSDGWIYNAGDSCWHVPAAGGNLEQVENVRGAFVYSAGVALPYPAADALSNADGAALVEMLKARPWSMPCAGDLMAGWMIASILAGDMPICPHVWVNAPAATGKTCLKNDLAACLKPFAVEVEGAGTTESAIRQKMNGDALPLLADEVEQGESKNDARNIRKWLVLMRSASYGGSITKGGADGTARAYPMKCGFALFSIINGISRDADASRCLVLSLDKAASRTLWQRQDAGRALTESAGFHSRMITRLLMSLPVLMENIRTLTAYLRGLDGVDARRGELFAVLLACRYVLTSPAPMTAADKEHAADILRAYSEQEEKESDSSRCLSVLLGYEVDIYGAGKKNVARACRLMSNMIDGETKDAYSHALELAGLRWRDDFTALQVDCRADKMKRIYRDTQWSNGKIAAVLAEGASKTDGKAGANSAGIWYQNAKIGKASPTRCIMIPAALIFSETD